MASNIISSKAVAERDARALCGAEVQVTDGALALSICDVLPVESRAFVFGYNIAEVQGQATAWRQAALLSRIWEAYKAANPTATQKTFATFFRAKPSTLAADIKCGADVKIVTEADGDHVVIPHDINGKPFRKSNYAQLYAWKGHIAKGTFTADDDQTAIKQKIKDLRGVIDEKPKAAQAGAQADEAAQATEGAQAGAQAGEAAEVKAAEYDEGDRLIVVFNDVPVELTEAQYHAICRILRTTRKPQAEAEAEAKPQAEAEAEAKPQAKQTKAKK